MPASKMISSGTLMTNNYMDDYTNSNNKYAVSLNGSSQYLNVTTAHVLLSLGTNSFTIETWIYQTETSAGAYKLIMQDNLYGGTTGGWAMYSYNNQLNIWKVVANVATELIAPAGSIPLSTWTHVAWSRNGSSNRIFINGVQVGATTTDSSSYTGTGVYIGASPVPSLYFPGSISNVRIVNGTALYTANFSPLAPLAAVTNTVLLTCQNPTIIDNSILSHAITNNGTVTTSTVTLPNVIARREYATGVIEIAGQLDDNTKTGGVSAFFNGTTQYLTMASNAAMALGTNNFTIEFWIYLNTTPGAVNAVYDNRPASTQGVYPHLYLTSDRTIRFWVSSADRITSSAMTLQTWYHVALVRSSSVTTMYLNGAVTGSTYSDTNDYLQNGTIIGGSYGGAASISNFFNGYLSNLRVTNGVAVYTGTPFTVTSPLQKTQVSGTNIAAITNPTSVSLLTCQNPVIIDNSSNGFTLTNNGGVATTIKQIPF
jgi:hypothetical protein